MNCESCGYELLDGEKRLHEECGCDFCGTTKRHELWVPECNVAVCHNENEKRIADAVAAERERCARLLENMPLGGEPPTIVWATWRDCLKLAAAKIRESNEGG